MKSKVIEIVENLYGSFIDSMIVIDGQGEMTTRSEISSALQSSGINCNVNIYLTITQFNNTTIIKM